MPHPQKVRSSWRPAPVFIGLGLLSAAYFAITGTVWAVTGEFTRLGGQAIEPFGADVHNWPYYKNVVHLPGNPLTRTDGWIVIAMLVGSLMSALFGGDFRVRMPVHRRRFIQALGGGIIAGFGARLALGCNLAAMFTGIPQFSFHAWIFTVATAIGSWVGVQIIRQRWWRGPTRLMRAEASTAVDAEAIRRRRLRHDVFAAALLIAMVLTAAGFFIADRPMLATAVIFGTMFGIAIQRGQICFTAAFRDLWLTGQTTMMKALIWGLGAATVATFVVIQAGWQPAAIKPAGWGTVAGGLLFGLGIVMAGACETGMMYRATEGQVQALFAFVGNIVGATVLAYGWSHWGIFDTLVKGSPKVDLMTKFTPFGALVLSLAVLAACYAAIWWHENRSKRAGARQEEGVLA